MFFYHENPQFRILSRLDFNLNQKNFNLKKKLIN
jgi:hypothetical protein